MDAGNKTYVASIQNLACDSYELSREAKAKWEACKDPIFRNVYLREYKAWSKYAYDLSRKAMAVLLVLA